MNNLFTKNIIELEKEPSDKVSKLLINIEIPANTKPSETNTQVEIDGPAAALVAFALQAVVDAMANTVAQKSDEDNSSQEVRNKRWTEFTAHLVEYITDICEVYGEKNGLHINGIRANARDVEIVYNVVKKVMEKRKEREEK